MKILKIIQDEMLSHKEVNPHITATRIVNLIVTEWLPSAADIKTFGEEYQVDVMARQEKPNWKNFARKFAVKFF